jgi:hypothetical protein
MQKFIGERRNEFGMTAQEIDLAVKSFPNIEVRSIFDDSVVVAMIGKHKDLNKELGWALRGLSTYEDFANPDKKFQVTLMKTLFIEMAKKFNLTKIYAPIANPHNGQIRKEGENFECEIVLNPEEVEDGEEPIVLYRDLNREGCKIEKCEAFYMPPADCLTIVVQDEFGNVVASHAGRDSLQDMKDVFKDNIFKNIRNSLKGNLSKVKVWIGFGIAAENFVHPMNENRDDLNSQRYFLLRYLYDDIGSENPIVSDDGKLNVYELAERQAREAFGQNVSIIRNESIDTFSDPRFYSHRKGGEDRMGRNGVFVISR